MTKNFTYGPFPEKTILTMHKIICLVSVFIIFSIFIRAKQFGLGYNFLLSGRPQIERALTVSYYDIFFITILSGAFIITSLLARNKAKFQNILLWIFTTCILLSIIWSLVNFYAVQTLNSPINYQMLYYSDIMDSEYVADAIAENFSIAILIKILLLILSILTVALLYYRISIFIIKPKFIFTTGAITIVSIFAYLILFNNAVSKLKDEWYDDYTKMLNPVIVFIKSVPIPFNDEGNIFSKFNSNTINTKLDKSNKINSEYSKAPTHPKVKNVILYVLESVPAEYIAGYGGKHQVTPNIQRHLSESVVFTNIYAHNPNSTNSLFSLLGSVYPLMSYKNIIYEKPDINLPTLSSELKHRDYKTAFFQASDNKYMRVDEYLSFRSFDKVVDHREIPCKTASFKSDAEGVGEGKNEICMVDAFSAWATTASKKSPFFAMLWTIQTHWPYFVFGPEKDFGVNEPVFNRYLNALNQSDAALGTLIDNLKKNGLYESTLIIVVGDHGESFGKHGQYGHGSNIYEENIRVPLIFINPLLFKGEKNTTVGGHIDVAATAMDLLGLDAPQGWQGTSLFDPSRTSIVFFFSTWTDYFFGYRTPEHKVIFNAYTNKTMIFDMLKDPNETTDLTNDKPELVKLSYERLGRWVQYNRAFLNNKLNTSPAIQSSSSTN